jgi:hypothetical protein
MHKDIS